MDVNLKAGRELSRSRFEEGVCGLHSILTVQFDLEVVKFAVASFHNLELAAESSTCLSSCDLKTLIPSTCYAVFSTRHIVRFVFDAAYSCTDPIGRDQFSTFHDKFGLISSLITPIITCLTSTRLISSALQHFDTSLITPTIISCILLLLLCHTGEDRCKFRRSGSIGIRTSLSLLIANGGGVFGRGRSNSRKGRLTERVITSTLLCTRGGVNIN
mmetsp:Transcript_14469/g.29583  ORF Transcript_14469/g.29583 Transcript_14469/m.29583 type:complete len:215 (+) Transcript_14469:899-1543(+)